MSGCSELMERAAQPVDGAVGGNFSTNHQVIELGRRGQTNPLAGIFRFIRKKEHMRIFSLLDARLISFLDVGTRDEAIDSLISLLQTAGKLTDSEKIAFRQAIFLRENLVSTGIGMGVAIPHAKLSGFPDFFIAIGIQTKSGIDWNALDKIPVRIIFLIGGPDNRQSEYLQILSQLTSAIKHVELRKSLLKSELPQQVLQLFSDL